jgi:hypothetical protein
MAATRTQGITVDTDANFTINKEYRGIRLPLLYECSSVRKSAQKVAHSSFWLCPRERRAYAMSLST